MTKEVLFYNGNVEPPAYELLEIDTEGLTKKQIKQKVIKIMKQKYGLEWSNYDEVIYLLDTNNLESIE